MPGKGGATAGPACQAYILGLLDALESDPGSLSQSLAAGSNSGDATGSSQTFETQAILASVARIADKLVKAQQSTGTQQLATPSATPPAANNETASRLMGTGAGSSSNAGEAAVVGNGPVSAVASPRSAVSSNQDHSSDGFDGQPLSAEKELRLLKAQVQDFARVCKVSSSIAGRQAV